MRQVLSVSTRVRCPIRSDVSLGVQHTYMYQAKTIRHSTLLFIMSANTNRYHVIDASHTTPITRVNRGLSYWNWSVEDIVHALGGFCTYPKSRPRFLALKQALPQGNQITCITSKVHE